MNDGVPKKGTEDEDDTEGCSPDNNDDDDGCCCCCCCCKDGIGNRRRRRRRVAAVIGDCGKAGVNAAVASWRISSSMEGIPRYSLPECKSI